MSRPLEGKFGIVTGGSRGIGEAIAKNLASKGCSLLLNFTSDSSRSRTEELCKTLASTHSIRCVSVQADLSTPEIATRQILDAAATHFPNTIIDILINNAGVSADRTLNDQDKGAIDAPYFNWQYNINVLAPLLLTQAVAPHLPNDRSGRIVNISSVSSSLGFIGQSVYGGTKAALEAMTRTWARELADRATVNAINPGPVTGDMYFKTGEGFWNQIQGFQDNTPLSKLVDGKDKSIRDPVFQELGLSEEQMPPKPLRLSATSVRSIRLPLRSTIRIPIRGISIPTVQQTQRLWSWKLSSNLSILSKSSSKVTTRPFTSSTPLYSPASSTSGKSQADLIVEELQELYETAQDELEIATESTDSATIYAASDRESARDALNSLVIAYELYTGTSTGPGSKVEELQKGEQAGTAGKEGEEDGAGEGDERIVELSFDPAGLEEGVREEVKKRIGQRIREVRSAVEGLEKRAHD
ncbi:SDR family NAD(P)-dependent oxidoreductase [Aspergillus undulatus]|uniref:SDR family NAD(P)-dependent oxidoreductase n=1 Tax=Aspergillus undulatus TaxID=1810928 RepID=UPI003CCDB25D